MKKFVTAASLLACVAFAAPAVAGDDPNAGPPVAAITLAPAKGNAKITVTSSVFKDGAAIDYKYTQYGENKSPPLSWTAGPAGTQSYVVMCEDMGGKNHDPVIHWVLYDQPTTSMSLPEAVPTDAKLPSGAMQALNQRKGSGYMGPRPPFPMTHPYHYEVFALDKKLVLDPTVTDRNAVVAAMKDHVLASGEIVTPVTGKDVPKN